MALTTTNHDVHSFPLTHDDRPDLPPAPEVAITPCDPWPRPYYLESGLRRVAPYHYTYNTFCKQRWRGREILDIFAAEFRDRSREYYKSAIEEGQIVINGKACRDIHTIVKNGDVVSHTLHRHEPPVTAQPIRVIHESDSMIVIDKPAGVPVHPAGRYNYNSVVEIMRAERSSAFNPLPCNRLDRLTSGVMFIGKTSKEAEEISAKLRGRTVRKEYVARVKGRFPDGEGWDGDAMRGGVVKCEESILQISPILGLNRARASGKSAKTLFRRIAYYTSNPEGQTPAGGETNQESIATVDETGYSIVHCLPLTGRTHQIRVHLQFLGHPITNDPIYSNRRVFGPELAAHDATDEHDAAIMERLGKMGKTETADTIAYSQQQPAPIEQTQQMTLTEARQRDDMLRHAPGSGFKPLHSGTMHTGSLTQPGTADTTEYATLVAAHDAMVDDYNKRKGEKMTGKLCSVCATPLYSDPGPQELGIYLHALAYADLTPGSWRYTSPMPAWALPPADADGVVRRIGPVEAPEWIYEGPGAEGLEIGDEKALEAERNEKGMKRNKDE